jgi:lipoate-protein ligase A
MDAAPGRTRVSADEDRGEAELRWLDTALLGSPSASLWTAPRELVAPLSYVRLPLLQAARDDSAARGWPVRMRRSGGGVVPQGPGLLNLSVACAYEREPARRIDGVYASLCAVLAAALRDLDIATVTGPVNGSFCDGRFNLAVADPAGGPARKVAGTAQYWRRSGARHAVLAHAVLIVDADVQEINEAVNRFEAVAGSGRVHSPQALVSVASAWSEAHGRQTPPPDLLERLERRLTLEIPRHFPVTGPSGKRSSGA